MKSINFYFLMGLAIALLPSLGWSKAKSKTLNQEVSVAVVFDPDTKQAKCVQDLANKPHFAPSHLEVSNKPTNINVNLPLCDRKTQAWLAQNSPKMIKSKDPEVAATAIIKATTRFGTSTLKQLMKGMACVSLAYYGKTAVKESNLSNSNNLIGVLGGTLGVLNFELDILKDISIDRDETFEQMKSTETKIQNLKTEINDLKKNIEIEEAKEQSLKNEITNNTREKTNLEKTLKSSKQNMTQEMIDQTNQRIKTLVDTNTRLNNKLKDVRGSLTKLYMSRSKNSILLVTQEKTLKNLTHRYEVSGQPLKKQIQKNVSSHAKGLTLCAGGGGLVGYIQND